MPWHVVGTWVLSENENKDERIRISWSFSSEITKYSNNIKYKRLAKDPLSAKFSHFAAHNPVL